MTRNLIIRWPDDNNNNSNNNNSDNNNNNNNININNTFTLFVPCRKTAYSQYISILNKRIVKPSYACKKS